RLAYADRDRLETHGHARDRRRLLHPVAGVGLDGDDAARDLRRRDPVLPDARRLHRARLLLAGRQPRHALRRGRPGTPRGVRRPAV
ncbi:hypothetical protein LTR94_031861, partial [Friedmanniomyces endolithicus]